MTATRTIHGASAQAPIALSTLLLFVVSCVDYRALTQDELDRHPPQPDRRYPSSPVAPGEATAGDWLLFRTHGAPVPGHVMEGWERLDVVKGPDGDGFQVAFRAQTPFDCVAAGATLATTGQNERGQFVIQTTGKKPQKVFFPRMGSWVSGRHQQMSEDISRRRHAVTPALIETEHYYDEQLLVRVAPLVLGSRLRADPTAPREDVAVPAGKFLGAVAFTITAEYFERPWLLELFASDTAHSPLGPVKIWIHDQVPATGVVKMEFPSGAVLELLDFGREGEKDHAR
jgi:hypothetical protein